ncbi:MAG TPA: hypothetical protein VHZ78_01505 [Rhizomicrobium sp.]|jgi:tetratricopeptide (TPR) repeat protein|nr:hypothetical protein [Rhizomicrobium sp.]
MSESGEAGRPAGGNGATAAGIALAQPLDPRAAAYLEGQTRLARLQSQNLIEQNEFEQSHLRWRRFNDQMGGALQMMLVAVGLLIVAAIAAALWDAAHDNGLVIEAFSVPPDLAAKGLTGEVVAGKVQDRLSAFQAQTVSSRASASYANNWGDDIKVQIPNTGVSIGEINRYLRGWLGHETRITGAIYRTPTGIAVLARAGADGSPIFTGSEADLDALIEKAAEHIYRSTQPYRYAIYLFDHQRYAEDRVVLQHIIATGSTIDRAWGYVGMASNAQANGDFIASAGWERKAIAVDPSLVLPRNNLANDDATLQHDEDAIADSRGAIEAAARGDSSMSETSLAHIGPGMRGQLDVLIGDFADALASARQILTLPDFNGSLENARQGVVQACGALYDAACTREAAAGFSASPDPLTLMSRNAARMLAAATTRHWGEALAFEPALHRTLRDGGAPTRFFATTVEGPFYALGAAHAGQLALAHRLIDATPADCVVCLRLHGDIAAVEHRWAAAAWWFARAAAAAPSSPYAYADWGEMLLRKGDFAGAIAQFDIANRKGPHFADPLELWGEALVASNRSDLALAKFEAAARTAPNWGRLHLKWGEALLWLGRRDEAKTQFARAATLDLTAQDARILKALLAKV